MIICVDCGQQKKHKAFGLCKPCYMRRWRRENPEKEAAVKRRYAKRHPEKVAASKRRWQRENPEKVAASTRRWEENNPERVAARQRRYCQANPEKMAAKNARRAARRRNAPCTLTLKQVEEEFAIARSLYPGEDLHIHHLVPLSKGGGTTLANIQVIPRELNLTIGDKLPEEVYTQVRFL